MDKVIHILLKFHSVLASDYYYDTSVYTQNTSLHCWSIWVILLPTENS